MNCFSYHSSLLSKFSGVSFQRSYRVLLVLWVLLWMSLSGCELEDWFCQGDLDCGETLYCKKGACVKKPGAGGEYRLYFLDGVGGEATDSGEFIEEADKGFEKEQENQVEVLFHDETEVPEPKRPEGEEVRAEYTPDKTPLDKDLGIRMTKLECTNYRRGWKTTCHIYGKNFQHSEKGWVGCLNDEPKGGKRLSPTKWEITGRWACCDAAHGPIEVNIKGSNGNFISSRKLDGWCGCDPGNCLKEGKTCGVWQKGDNYLRCGVCPTGTKCLPSGHCSCNKIYSVRCFPKEKKTYNYDSCGNKGTRRDICSVGCLEVYPHDNDRCQTNPPKDLCKNGAKNGTYCFKQSLVTCTNGQNTGQVLCPNGCIISPSPGKASCLKKRGKAIVHSSGLCLAVSGGFNFENANVVSLKCDGSLAQQWLINGKEIRNAMGYCLDIRGHSEGCANVRVHKCYGGIAQRWTLQPSGQIKHGYGLCLATYGDRNVDGVNVHLYDCRIVTKQKWKIQ